MMLENELCKIDCEECDGKDECFVYNLNHTGAKLPKVTEGNKPEAG